MAEKRGRKTKQLGRHRRKSVSEMDRRLLGNCISDSSEERHW